ncbi:hypothetical protein CVT24_006368 [Panaeolus cyanescens]|uniref:Beta-glucuronidase C-terminal domain-containing protein n=1 Tax=Panaeolus cyanescens TaxID=181874 RepID=A0A409YE64_9AGAR|nr:hypothetical protein CVT24_006368 [Panaeolus cyanescens]
MISSSVLSFLGLVSWLSSPVSAVTVYGQIPLAQTISDTASPTDGATAAPQPTLAAYNSTQLIPPQLPDPPPALSYALNTARNAASVNGLSLPHVGPSFWGFSIEMSVLTQVLGKNSSFIGVPFLNLIANLQERAGGVYIRIGGNTQEFATMVPEDSPFLLPYHTFGKTDSGTTQTTKTPAVLYTIDMFYIASNISSLVNVKWFLGIPFNDSVNWRLDIAEYGEEILGDNLLGLQAGNEPDFYETFGRRVAPYTPADYANEVDNLISVIDNNPRIPRKNILVGPSIATGPWTPEQVWETNYIDRFKDRMFSFSVENYPHDNCAAQYDTGRPHRDPQEMFPYYMNHHNLLDHVGKYTNTGNLVAATGKPLIMFETNTASCGGFMGISDSFGAALWATDYGFLLAHNNFTHGMLHVGGQNAFYNPFTSPPTNQSAYNQWTVGAVYYSTLVLAEAFGKTNMSRIVDLRANFDSPYTPAYAIYENDALSKVALFNYMDDLGTGSHTINVAVTVPEGIPASSVRVKYLSSPSVSSKNITWAGQTFGEMLTVDGRLRGEMDIPTIQCDSATNACTVPVRAPGFALVFFDQGDQAMNLGQATQTFATSAYTKLHNTAYMDPSVIATSNGHSGTDRLQVGSTSQGSVSAAQKVGIAVSLLAGLVGCVWVLVK